jgi:hypothetical protein
LSSAVWRMALSLMVCSCRSVRCCSTVGMIARLKYTGQYLYVWVLATRWEVLLSVAAKRLPLEGWAVESQMLSPGR